MKTDEQITHELEAVQQHLRWLVVSIGTTPLANGKVSVSFKGTELHFQRDMLLSEVTEEAVRRCLKMVFPHVVGERSTTDCQIRKNGRYYDSADSFDAARQIIASKISSEEEIWVIEDNSGFRTRFVANEDGSLRLLD